MTDESGQAEGWRVTKDFIRSFNGRIFSGELRVVESSHRGLGPMEYSLMAGNLYVGSELFKRLDPRGNK